MPNPNARMLKEKWSASYKPLVGRKIIEVRWMTAAEQKACAWYRAPIVIQLDDGTLLIPQSDDEGNDAGALSVQAGSKTKGVPDIAPVI